MLGWGVSDPARARSFRLAPDLANHRIGRALFLRGLGLVHLIAMASWWVQADLLVGSGGLSPLGERLAWVAERAAAEGRSAFFALPNLFWWIGPSDLALHALCLVGCLLAILVAAGRGTAWAMAGLWVIYLSLVNTGGVFMSFQWDVLLLEATFLALFLSPWRWRNPWRNPPPLTPVHRIALVFAWFLVAKLMFFSGWVKLAWSSEASPEWWPEGTAMTFHYMTQPLPTATAWWMHQLPAAFHRFSLVPVYLVEIVLPFAILLGRRGRLVAAVGFAGLMALVQLTGNYTYFNLLTVVLCLPLIHDRDWRRWLPRCLGIDPSPSGLVPPELRPELSKMEKRRAIPLAAAAPFFLVLALLNGRIVLGDLRDAPHPLWRRDLVPDWLDALAGRLSPFSIASGYGLFRTMTTERPEIVLEGSADGIRWLAYDFAWKVDEIAERPRFVAPHQPRVAWQFWFAALEGRHHPRSRNAAWFESLLVKLFEGDPQVKRLLRRDPFPDTPPRFLRARLMRYEFTNLEERRRTGDWWRRVVVGEYLPEVTRREPVGEP